MLVVKLDREEVPLIGYHAALSTSAMMIVSTTLVFCSIQFSSIRENNFGTYLYVCVFVKYGLLCLKNKAVTLK